MYEPIVKGTSTYGATRSGSSAAINYPTSATGDFIVAWVEMSRSGTGVLSPWVTPAGWTLAAQANDLADDRRLSCIVRFRGAETSFQVVSTGTVNYNVIVTALEGASVDPVTPIQTSATYVNSGTGVAAPGVTTVEPDTLLLAFSATRHDFNAAADISWATPTELVQVTNTTYAVGTSRTTASVKSQVASVPGATGDLAATFNIAFNTRISGTVAVNPSTEQYTGGASATTLWSSEASMVKNINATGSIQLDTVWGTQASGRILQTFTDSIAATTSWAAEAEGLLTPLFSGSAGPYDSSLGDGPKQTLIGIREANGTPVGSIVCSGATDLTWGADYNATSNLSLTAYDDDLEPLIPWLHWVDVWEDGVLAWTGPIQTYSRQVSTNRVRLTAKDASVFGLYTRIPFTKNWAGTYTIDAALALFQHVFDLHNTSTGIIALPPTDLDKFFQFNVKESDGMVDRSIGELSKLGLSWTVVRGKLILGNWDRNPVTTLRECDFSDALEVQRDGRRMANDVRLQGANFAHTVRKDMAGLNLQALISLDSLVGVASIQSAAISYLKDRAVLRQNLVIPADATLSPEAPIDIREIIPGAWVNVHVEGENYLHKIKSMSRKYSKKGVETSVTLQSYVDILGETDSLE